MLARCGDSVYVVRYGWTGWEFDARTKSRVRRGSTARLSAVMTSTSNRSQLSRAKRNPRGRGTLQRRLAGRGATAIRPRLLGLMERSAGLTVIDSPRGFGKTELAALWLTTLGQVPNRPVVWVPAPTTSLCAAKLVECLVDAGVPDGAVNVVFGPGAVVGGARTARGTGGAAHGVRSTVAPGTAARAPQ